MVYQFDKMVVVELNEAEMKERSGRPFNFHDMFPLIPGTYRGECTDEFGYWARLRNTTGMVNGIIANNVVRGPFVVTILPADKAVELRGVTLRAAE